jgi:hypothetical protein
VKINLTIVKGDIADLQKSVRRLSKESKQRIKTLVENVSLEAANDARDSAPVNVGTLKKGIRHEVLVMGTGEVDVTGRITSNAEYSSGVEFGRTPGTWPNREAILWWVKRKGIAPKGEEERVAFLVSRKIAEKGIDPVPFMRPAYEKWAKRFDVELTKILRGIV